MFFYDSQLGCKLAGLSDMNEPEYADGVRTPMPYMAAIKSSVFEYNTAFVTPRLKGQTINRIGRKVGSALILNKVSLVDSDIRSLNKKTVYLCAPDFLPYVQYLNGEGYKILDASKPFYSGFKPYGKFKGAIISQPTEYGIAKLPNGRLVFQSVTPDDNGRYLVQHGSYSIYVPVNYLAQTSFADLKLKMFRSEN